MQRIQQAAGLLFSTRAGGPRTFRGSCFSYRRPDLFLTANHCVAESAPEELGIGMPAVGNALAAPISIARVLPHPTADVAMLLTGGVPEASPYVMTNVDWASGWGERVVTFGYPEDTAPQGMMPTARMLQGVIQRFFDYDDGRGMYRAIELSVPAPAGLSGSPVSRTQDTGAVIGVVSANHTASTYSGAFEVTDHHGTWRAQERHVVQYGIAVYLPEILEWLDDAVRDLSPVA